jgi:hypothetical protein
VISRAKRIKKCTLSTFASHQTQSLVPVVRPFAALKEVLSEPTTKHKNEKPLKSFSPAFRLNAPQGAYSIFFLLVDFIQLAFVRGSNKRNEKAADLKLFYRYSIPKKNRVLPQRQEHLPFFKLKANLMR